MKRLMISLLSSIALPTAINIDFAPADLNPEKRLKATR